MKAPKKRPRGRPPAQKGNAPSGNGASGESFASREHHNVSTPSADDETDPPLLVVEVEIDPLDLHLDPRRRAALDRLIAALADPLVDVSDLLADSIEERLAASVKVWLHEYLGFDPESARHQRMLDERRLIPFSEFNNRRIARLAASDPDDGSDDDGDDGDDGDGGGA